MQRTSDTFSVGRLTVLCGYIFSDITPLQIPQNVKIESIEHSDNMVKVKCER